MRQSEKLYLVDRKGTEVGERYKFAVERLGEYVMRRYPELRDPVDRANTIEEAVCRATDYEANHGEAGNLGSLLRRIFDQVVSSKYRNGYHGLYEEPLEEAGFEAKAAHWDVAETIDRHVLVKELFENLDPRSREALLLDLEDFTAGEIAAKMGVAKENVYQIVSRARAKLRKLLS
jgi:RNA polymerase sigma factor (sigma-70 family)